MHSKLHLKLLDGGAEGSDVDSREEAQLSLLDGGKDQHLDFSSINLSAELIEELRRVRQHVEFVRRAQGPELVANVSRRLISTILLCLKSDILRDMLNLSASDQLALRCGQLSQEVMDRFDELIKNQLKID